jgi:type I restriction enzyme S subunit
MNQFNLRSLPDGWRWVRLDDVIGEAQPGFASGQRDPNGVIQLRMNNVDTRGNISLAEHIRVPADEDTVARYQLVRGDVMFNNTNSTELVGKTALFPGFDEPVVYSNHFTRLRVVPEFLEPNYLAMWLVSQWQQKVFENLCNRWIGQSAVKNEKLLALEIPLPSLAEQRRIAAILAEQMAAVDKARAAVEQQVSAAKQLPAAYLREVFESDEAKGWGRKKLGELCEFKNGINFDATQKGIGVLTVDVLNMYSDSITLKMDNLYRVDAKLDDQYYLRENDMLFVRSSVKKEGIGWSALFPGYSERVTFCGFLIRARLTKDILPSFILYYLRQPMIRDWFASSAGQMAITNISQEKLKSIEIPVPSIETQQRIVTHLERQTNETGQLQNSVQTQLDSINQLPAALLRRAFNGEL